MRTFGLILLFSITFSSLKAQNYTSWNYQVTCINSNSDKAISIRVTENSNRKKFDIEQLKKYAVHALLLKGVTGSACTSQPALITDKEFVENKKYFDQFFSKKAVYSKYIIFVDDFQKEEFDKKEFKEKKLYSTVFSVDKEQLRRDLISGKIIKALNTGF